MADSTLSSLTTRGTPDRANDIIYIVKAGAQFKSTINNELGISGNPVGDSDSQTLTNKTFTSPTISGPTLSGTIIGTYTLGGTPTFPASVVTLTGSQTLTNKTLTAPTMTTPTLTNASITQDAVVGFSTANTGTVYGISIVGGVLTGPSTVPTAALQSGSVTSAKLTLSYGFSAYSTTAQNSGNAAYALTNFPTEEYDIGSNFAASVFTAPVTGYYHFDGRVGTAAAYTIWILSLFKNGSAWKAGTDIRTSSTAVAGVVGVSGKLIAGDTVDLRTFGNAALAIDITQINCFFTGYFIGN